MPLLMATQQSQGLLRISEVTGPTMTHAFDIDPNTGIPFERNSVKPTGPWVGTPGKLREGVTLDPPAKMVMVRASEGTVVVLKLFGGGSFSVTANGVWQQCDGLNVVGVEYPQGAIHTAVVPFYGTLPPGRADWRWLNG